MDAADLAVPFALSAAIGFGAAIATSTRGLRYLDAHTGAMISLPTATVLFLVLSPFTIDLTEFQLPAALIFAALGLFFPALATLLSFASITRLGSTVTSTISSTAPLYALLGAALILNESVPARAAVASLLIVLGIGLLSWKSSTVERSQLTWVLLLPLSNAVVRGLAQVVAKLGLFLWPNPFSVALISYTVSSVIVLAAGYIRADRKQVATGGSWFVLTGLLNGVGVLFLYSALRQAPISLVAPIVAVFPMVTAVLGTFLGERRPTPFTIIGVVVIVGAVSYLVAE